MKSIRQQLQSRISKRRNFIFYMERQKHQQLAIIKDVGEIMDVSQFKNNLAQIRVELKALHADQKLDKQLYVMVLEYELDAQRLKEFWDSAPSLELF
jgi:hypothetical protein